MRWLFSQKWQNLLFAHWPADPEPLEQLLPRSVELDVRDEHAWLAIVAFVMVDSRTTVPRCPRLRPIPELNVRTYVRVDGVPAVWFLSLDASSPPFVSVGRSLYGLRYHVARMAVVDDGARVHYLSDRRGAAFAAAYEPVGPPARAEPGTLEDFLVERYRLFASRRGRLVTAVVSHEPWPLQPANARIEVNTMAPSGLGFEGEPLLHFSRSVDALISAPEPVPGARGRELRGAPVPRRRRVEPARVEARS